jgi:hypothetical protein
VTTDTELHGVGGFHGGVESTPEEDAGEETHHKQGQQRILCTGCSQGSEKFGQHLVFLEEVTVRRAIKGDI